MKKEKLNEGKGIGGRGRLTNVDIHRLNFNMGWQ